MSLFKVDALKDAIGLGSGGPLSNQDKDNLLNVGDLINESDSKSYIGGYAVSSMFTSWPILNDRMAFNNKGYAFYIYEKGGAGSSDSVKWEITLPLNPSNISISVPAAVSVSATMRGIIEEHNDAPLRHINISGTTGIRPTSGFQIRSTNAGIVGNLLKYAFKNTIQAVSGTVGQFRQAINTVSGFFGNEIDTPAFLKPQSDGTTFNQEITGYDIIHRLQRFFDFYLAAKKAGAEGKNLRLEFAMYRDEMFYDCTLNGYNIQKSAGTLEYTYSIQLTAWKRKSKSVKDVNSSPVNRQVSTDTGIGNPFARASLALKQTRAAVTSINGILRGISSDYEAVCIEPIKQLILLANAVAGVRDTVADFPKSISVELYKEALPPLSRRMFNRTSTGDAVGDLNGSIAKALGKTREKLRTNNDPSNPFGDLAIAEENSGRSDVPGNRPETTNPIETLLKNPDDLDETGSQMPIDTLELSAPLEAAVAAVQEKARLLTDYDVSIMKYNFDNFTTKVAEAFGGGSATYNRINGLSTPKASRKKLSTADIEILKTLNDASIAMDQLIVSLRNAKGAAGNDYAAYYADYARTQGIDFAQNSSKFYIPFPAGATLEAVAVQYLGNIDRWIEIAAINGLKEPYVDEEGFIVPLVGSGSGSTAYIANSENFYVGQVVLISSKTVQPERRRITAIDIISSVETILTFSGESDLGRFLASDSAQIKAFLPNTVNSNMMIAIPSSVPVNIPGNIQLNPDETDLNTIALSAKADFMLQLSPFGESDLKFLGNDLAIARGMQNLVQAANIKVLTKKGELLNDPTFGNPVSIGSNVAETSAASILNSLSATFNSDPRFTGVLAGRVKIDKGAAAVSLLLGVSGSKAFLPFTTMLPR